MAPELPGIGLAALGDEAAPDIGSQVAAIGDLGWPGIELRTVGGRQMARLRPQAFARVAAAVAAGGLRTVAVSSGIGGWQRTTSTPQELDLRELEILAPRARRLGTRYVRVMSFANDGLSQPAWRAEALRRLRTLAALAAELDVVLLHENCSGWAGQGAEQTLDLVTAVDSPSLLLLFDIGNCLAYGQDPVGFLAAVLPWVAHVHVKDGVRSEGGVRWVAPGTGEARVEECLRMLASGGYRGSWVIEPHLQVAPHRGEYVAGDAGARELVGYGRTLERLIADAVAPVLGEGRAP
jgi:L-ribulose-5-phosphate 3-epimerase